MQVEGTHLKRSHGVKLLQDEILVTKISGDVQHQPSVAEPRIVQNAALGQGGILVQHHLKAGFRAEYTCLGNSENVNALFADRKLVGFVTSIFRNIQRVYFLYETFVAKMNMHITSVMPWGILALENLISDRSRNDVARAGNSRC